MSLRKSPQLTPGLLAAKRSNARRSTGPSTPAGKQNSKMNALKHGAYAAEENHHQVMLALGEDPEEFESLKQELMTSFGPGHAPWEKQIDDLAKLYWRRARLERAQQGVMRRALRRVEDWQHRRRQEMAGATFDASQPQLIDISMTEPTDPGVRLRMLLSYLGVIRAQVKQRIFKPRQRFLLETYYRGQNGWRQARLCDLLYMFVEEVKRRAHPEEEDQEGLLPNEFGPREQAGEPQYQELLCLLDEEIAGVQEEFRYAEKANDEKAAIERDACLAPVGEEWGMMLRREETLDRSIDRKVRILLWLRKELATRSIAPPSRDDGGRKESTEEVGDSNIMSHNLQRVEAVEGPKMKERSGNVPENKGPAIRSPGRSGNIKENKSSYGQDAGMLPKRKGVIGSAESHAPSISRVNTMTVPREPNGDQLG